MQRGICTATSVRETSCVSRLGIDLWILDEVAKLLAQGNTILGPVLKKIVLGIGSQNELNKASI